MGNELNKVTSDVYLILGNRDILFPYERSIQNARNRLPSLKEVVVLPNVGHGIETFPLALDQIVSAIFTTKDEK